MTENMTIEPYEARIDVMRHPERGLFRFEIDMRPYENASAFVLIGDPGRTIEEAATNAALRAFATFLGPVAAATVFALCAYMKEAQPNAAAWQEAMLTTMDRVHAETGARLRASIANSFVEGDAKVTA